MVIVKYKEVFDLELEDEGVFEGERYKISRIERKFDRATLTLYNDKKVVCNVRAEEFAVKAEHSLTLDEFAQLYKEAIRLRLIEPIALGYENALKDKIKRARIIDEE